jgi:uncharacterized protein (DUF1697 family)
MSLDIFTRIKHNQLMRYIALLRGINVGGKNKVSMTQLKHHLENVGYKNVRSYINSGNVLFESALDAKTLGTAIEKILVQNFTLDSSLIRVLVLTSDQLKRIVDNKPAGFGEQPEYYHSDVIFLINMPVNDAMKVFSPKEGVDTVWQGDGVIYSRRVSEHRTKSRLNRIMGTPEYKSMTIRNWNTTTKLLELIEAS